MSWCKSFSLKFNMALHLRQEAQVVIVRELSLLHISKWGGLSNHLNQPTSLTSWVAIFSQDVTTWSGAGAKRCAYICEMTTL